MKTLNNILLVCSLILTFSSRANNGEEAINKEVSSKLKKAVVMPDSFKAKHGSYKVNVSFLVNEDGRVTEVSAHTSDKQAKRDIENQFMNLTFKELSSCIRHSIDINFLFL